MTEIRPVGAADAPALTELLSQLGYPSELQAVTTRLAGIVESATHQIFIACRPDRSRIDGYLAIERRFTLHDGEYVEITDLIVDAAARRSGLGRALAAAAEQWTLRHALHTIVVRSNVVRSASHPFYEAIGYQRTATSHVYCKQV